MAQSYGFTCDVCHTFVAVDQQNGGPVTAPVGWIRVKPICEHAHHRDREHLEVCSNTCLVNLALARWENEEGNYPGKRFTRRKVVHA